jgi:hypothetical protein
MYKPNGEEPMTKQEEMQRKEALTARVGKEAKSGNMSGNMRSAFYAALFGAASSRNESVGSTFEHARY